jgi:acetyl-CoA synthetase
MATNADDPMLLYFTSGTTAKPKLVRHSQRSYPVGGLSTCTGSGCSRHVHLNISSPAGPSTPGAASSRPGMPALPCSSQPAALRGQGIANDYRQMRDHVTRRQRWRLFIQESWRRSLSLREVCGAGSR